MNKFPLLSDRDIDAIYSYVDKEAKRLNVPQNFNLTVCDSCDKNNVTANPLNSTTNDSTAKPQILDTSTQINSLPVNYLSSTTEYYQVNIEAYGWYNIDKLLKDSNELQKCKLIVDVNTLQDNTNTNVYLIIPSLKVITNGYHKDNNNNFIFSGIDENINLPLNTDAFILAITEEQDDFYYKQKRFTIKKEQVVTMELAKSTREAIYESFKLLQLNDINFSIEKEKLLENEYYPDSSKVPAISRITGNLQDSLIKYSNPCDCSSLNAK